MMERRLSTPRLSDWKVNAERAEIRFVFDEGPHAYFSLEALPKSREMSMLLEFSRALIRRYGND